MAPGEETPKCDSAMAARPDIVEDVFASVLDELGRVSVLERLVRRLWHHRPSTPAQAGYDWAPSQIPLPDDERAELQRLLT